MLVRFHGKAGSLTMFGEVAIALLRLMGMSGSVPGAVLAADIPVALRRLRQGIDAQDAQTDSRPASEGDEDAEPRISLRTRAYPLVHLLAAAAAQDCDVIWEDESKATG